MDPKEWAAQDKARQKRDYDEAVDRWHKGQMDFYSNKEKGPSCFPGSTLVRTPHGYTRLDSVKEGDRVMSVNREGCMVPAVVKRVRAHSARPVISVVSNRPGMSFFVTDEHLILIQRGWVRAKRLRRGDIVLNASESGQMVHHTVERIERSDAVWEPVYNLIVEDTYTYLVQGCVAHSFAYFRVPRSWWGRLWSALGRGAPPRRNAWRAPSVRTSTDPEMA